MILRRNLVSTIPVFDLQTHHEQVKLPESFDMRDLSRKHQVFPLKVIEHKQQKKLLLAMRNPLDRAAILDCEFRAGMAVIPVLAEADDIQWLVQTHYFGRKLTPAPSLDNREFATDGFQHLERLTLLQPFS